MISPDLDVQGGISSVVNEYLRSDLDRKVSLTFIPSHRDGTKLLKAGVFVRTFFCFLFVLLKIESPIIHLHVSQDGSFVRKFILFIISKLFRRKTIVHLHGSDFEEFMHKTKVHQALTKFMFLRADIILVLSDRWKHIIKSFAQCENVITLYNPIKACEKNIRNHYPIHVLFLGRLGKRKGTYDLFECIKVHKEFFLEKNIYFILAGDGDVDIFKKFVAEEGLDELVTITGWCAKEQKEELLIKSNILILPSYNEQMPMSILEAMAHGYPIISTDVAGIPEMVMHGENGFLFKPGDIDGMYQALKQLCEDRALRERMGAKSLQIVADKFDSDLIVSKLVGIYQSISQEE